MNKTVIRIFIYFVLTAAAISLILLTINITGFAFLQSDPNGNNVKGILNDISQALYKDDKGFHTNEDVIPSDHWCILLDDMGDIIWSENKPTDIPDHYSLKDIARISKWFLEDYPVYMRIEDYGLIILGAPKNSVGKYPIEYSMSWFDALPERILKIIIINLELACVLACIFGMGLYKRLKILLKGINDLREEKSVKLKEKGIFRELCQSLNETSRSLERKNMQLSARDNARLNWIWGISHDIRTPLLLVISNAEALEGSGLPESGRKRASAIKTQGLRIKKLVEDLNIISSLEYDMQPGDKSKIKICPLIRRITADIINSGLDDKYSIALGLGDERAAVSGDEKLLERALFNIINNSITHNKEGCRIEINERVKNGYVYIEIKDNGKGIEQSVIENIGIMPKTAHGIGLPMAYKIINVHDGNMEIMNNNGAVIRIMLRAV